MSRGTFILGLLLSVAIHAWLVMLPWGRVTVTQPPAPTIVVPVVETELARLDQVQPDAETEVEPPAPEPQQTPQPPAPEPVDEVPPPKPEPEPAPRSDPEPATPVESRLKLVKVAEPDETPQQEPGDFGGSPEGRHEPQLRINWGTGDQARSALEAGGMILVVLNGTGGDAIISEQVAKDAEIWRRTAYPSTGSTKYSNRLRIVDNVPAFDDVRRAVNLRGQERLAVLLPLHIERVLESAQMEAAYKRGLIMKQIDNFAGRFTLRDGALAFHITHVRANGRKTVR